MVQDLLLKWITAPMCSFRSWPSNHYLGKIYFKSFILLIKGLLKEIRKMKDNGGRRLLIDRRKCTEFDHFPERRTLRFRRSDFDRRKAGSDDDWMGVERRANFK